MKRVTAKELKNRTGEVIRSLRGGEEVVVSYRGKPLGKFIPIGSSSIGEELSGVIKDAPDKKQIRNQRLQGRHEDIY
jgi:prevent-host-death family protein